MEDVTIKMIKDLENIIKRLENADSYVWKLQRKLLKFKRIERQTESELEKKYINGKIEMLKEVIEEMCKIYKIKNQEIIDWHI